MSDVDIERTFKKLCKSISNIVLKNVLKRHRQKKKVNHAKRKQNVLFFLCKEAKLKFRIIT